MILGLARAPGRLVVTSAIVLAGAVVLAVSHRDRARDVWQAVARLPVPALGGALLLVLAQFGCQASRLWALVPSRVGLTWRRAARAFAVGEWTNIVAPARAGDALKVVLLARATEGAQPIGLPAATGAILADKVVDAGSFVVVSAAAAAWTGLAAQVLRTPLPAPATVLLACLVGALVLWGIRLTASPSFERLTYWRHELARALAVLTAPRHLLPSAAASLGAWMAETLALRILTSALGFPVPLAHIVLALALLNLGTSVPVTLGNLGVYEGVLALGLSRVGVPAAVAVAIATAHHALELLATNLGAATLSLALARPRPPARSSSD